MNNQDVINYFNAMNNDDVIENVMNVLNGFIDIRPLGDRNYIKTGLSARGVDIAGGICHRDDDD